MPSSAIQASQYRASDETINDYKRYLQSQDDFPSIWAAADKAYQRRNEPWSNLGDCKLGEIAALIDYTGAGYQEVNQTLRRLGSGQSDIDQVLETRIKTTVSAVNCVSYPPEEEVYRGSNYTPETLARYVVGQPIVEYGFTSTSIGAIQYVFY